MKKRINEIIQTITAAKLIRKKIQKLRMIVSGLVPEGLIILSGRPKSGKSLLALDIAIAVSTGSEVLGVQVEKGVVLYLALEDSEGRLQRRFRQVAEKRNASNDLHFRTTWSRLNEVHLNGLDGFEQIQAWVKQQPKTRLIIVDTFAKVAPIRRGGGSTAYRDDYNDLERIQAYALKKRIGVMLIHHNRKATSEHDIDLVSGTAGLTGCADTILVLKRPPNTPASSDKFATLSVSGRDVDENALALKHNHKTLRWENMGDATIEYMSSERREVHDFIGSCQMTPTEVAQGMGKDYGVIKNLLSKMFLQGQLGKWKGRYRQIR